MSEEQFLPSFEGTWARLSQVAVKGAQYNSPERQPHPKCLEGTRVDLLKYIHGLLDEGEKNRLIWLHGTAGVGKSAVAFTVAERMKGLKVTEETNVEKRLAGTFFFSRKHTKRCTARYLFATLVYQLANNFPSIRKDVNRIIRDNPALLDPDAPLCDQMEALFLQPLRWLRFRLRECPPLTFVIDALDECTSEPELTDLILSLARALREPDLPLTHILLTSRSESRIFKAFQNKEVRPLLCEIPVKTSGEGIGTIVSLDGDDVDNDIYIFLQYSFGELADDHPDFPQPSRDQLAKLASRAGRRFIVASTMMKFIKDGDRDPRDQLHLMLELSSELLPGTEVYKLYDYILSTCADPHRAYTYLSIVAALADPLPMSQISKLLGPRLGKNVETALMQLRSVMDIPTDTSLPVNIHHSSVRDYVSNPSNCSLLQVRDMSSPHSLLADSSLRLMIHEIPESTAFLDAVSELKKQSRAMKARDPCKLKDSLAFLVLPPEPLSVLTCMLWLRGGRTSDPQSWLGTADGCAWLQTKNGRDWLQIQQGRDWLQTQGGRGWLQIHAGRSWLQTHGAQDWLQTHGARDWLQTQAALDWLRTQAGRVWLQTQAGRAWLQTQAGQDWLQTQAGRDWLQIQAGRDWLQTKGAQNWVQTLAGRDWLQTQGARDWVQTFAGKHWLKTQDGEDWVQTPAGRDWLQTQGGEDWLLSPRGKSWLQTQGGRDWSHTQTPAGRHWLQTQKGRDWLQTQAGQDWLQTQAGQDWLQTQGGRDWLQTQGGRDWVQTQGGRDWVQTHGGEYWLQTRGGEDWLQTQAARDWLQTQGGEDWLQTQAARDWLQGQVGRNWVQTQGGRDWLQTQGGRDWLQTQGAQYWVQTPAGRDWLQTRAGRCWLQTQGARDWMQTLPGRYWLQTQRGKYWLQTQAGPDWLQIEAEPDWLHNQAETDSQTQEVSDQPQTQAAQGWLRAPGGLIWMPPSGRDWLQAQVGQDWLQTKQGCDWLQTQGVKDWLQTPGGQDWLQTPGGQDWLQSTGGRDWLQTLGGLDWLQISGGRDWLQTLGGLDWLQTPHGQAWQSTPAASVWVTMEEFSSTLEAVSEYIIVPESSSLPPFQVVQQFKSLPDFLMFPMFLALMPRGHVTPALPVVPDGGVVHAMNVFTAFAHEAQERSQSASDALKYACQNWVVHLLHAPNPWDDTLNRVFQAFWNRHLLSWLERQWCLKGLRSCLDMLSEGQKLVKFEPVNARPTSEGLLTIDLDSRHSTTEVLTPMSTSEMSTRRPSTPETIFLTETRIVASHARPVPNPCQPPLSTPPPPPPLPPVPSSRPNTATPHVGASRKRISDEDEDEMNSNSLLESDTPSPSKRQK